MRQAIAYALNREQLVKTKLPEGAQGRRRSSCRDTVPGYTDDVTAVRLRPGQGQGAAQGGRRRGPDAATSTTRPRSPGRTCRTRRRSSRVARDRPGGRRHQGRRRSPSRGTVATSTTSSSRQARPAPARLDRRLQRRRTTSSARSSAGAKTEFGTRRRPEHVRRRSPKADAIVDEADAARPAVRGGQPARSCRSTCRPSRSAHSPPAIVVSGKDVKGLVAEPADRRASSTPSRSAVTTLATAESMRPGPGLIRPGRPAYRRS